MITFWIHCSSEELLDGRGFPVKMGNKSEKLTIWPNKEVVLKYVKKTFNSFEDKGDLIIVPGNGGPLYLIKIELDPNGMC